MRHETRPERFCFAARRAGHRPACRDGRRARLRPVRGTLRGHLREHGGIGRLPRSALHPQPRLPELRRQAAPPLPPPGRPPPAGPRPDDALFLGYRRDHGFLVPHEPRAARLPAPRRAALRRPACPAGPPALDGAGGPGGRRHLHRRARRDDRRHEPRFGQDARLALPHPPRRRRAHAHHRAERARERGGQGHRPRSRRRRLPRQALLHHRARRPRPGLPPPGECDAGGDGAAGGRPRSGRRHPPRDARRTAHRPVARYPPGGRAPRRRRHGLRHFRRRPPPTSTRASGGRTRAVPSPGTGSGSPSSRPSSRRTAAASTATRSPAKAAPSRSSSRRTGREDDRRGLSSWPVPAGSRPSDGRRRGTSRAPARFR